MNWPEDDWPMANTTQPPSRLLWGVELHVTAHHRQGSEAATKSTTLLVNFEDTPQAIEKLEMLFGSVAHVQRYSRLFSGPDGVTKRVAFLCIQKISTVDAVRLMAGDREIEATGEQAIVDALRKRADGLVVIADEDCLRWAGLRAISGFVRSAKEKSAFAATVLARILAALRTPLKFTGLDPDDIVHSFSSPSQSAVFADVIYPDSEDKAKFANAINAALVRDLTNVAAGLTATNTRFVGLATSTLCAALNPDCDFTF